MTTPTSTHKNHFALQPQDEQPDRIPEKIQSLDIIHRSGIAMLRHAFQV